MKSTSYGVIGLGKFGSVVATELLEQGHTVIIADKDEEAVKKIKANYAYILDSTNTEALAEAGFADVEVVVVSIGENVEKSILTLMALKEIGAAKIIAKATSNIHGQILSKLGAAKVIYPERESARRLARQFLAHPNFEIFELSANTIRAVKITVSSDEAGASLGQLAQNLRVIAYKKEGEDWDLLPELETTVAYAGDLLVLLGTAKELGEFER